MNEMEKMIWAAAYVHKLFAQPPEVSDEKRASVAAAAAMKAVTLLKLADCPEGEHLCATRMMLAIVRGELHDLQCYGCDKVTTHGEKP